MGSVGQSNHLEFDKQPLEKGRKLHKYKVRNHTLYQNIGVIHWRGGWRQYVFQAKPEVDMTRGCHKQIDEFIDGLMKEWNESQKKKKDASLEQDEKDNKEEMSKHCSLGRDHLEEKNANSQKGVQK